jgi:histidinol-phosphate/aromatic aminotransferase/cobyric acid decarboxylase-like protein/GNAT superfamily N-acetyltransferase
MNPVILTRATRQLIPVMLSPVFINNPGPNRLCNSARMTSTESRALLGRNFSPERLTLRVARPTDRLPIYRLRHAVYAQEIGQHPVCPSGQLSDALDQKNVYLVAQRGNELCGFISITPPRAGTFSLSKYFPNPPFPFAVDDTTYEVRLLTVHPAYRGSQVATLLMYAALRWVQSHGGTRIVALGRREVLELYLRVGLERAGHVIQSGAVTYELLIGQIQTLTDTVDAMHALQERWQDNVDWQLGCSPSKAAPCFHGGRFFGAIGVDFEHLERSAKIINADVLDAWFDPSPKVLTALTRYLPWLTRTSPPTGCEGLVETIAQARGVHPSQILPGNGSSDLIFRALRQWLDRHSRVLLLDPTYGEYAHVLERVIGCRVDRLRLCRTQNYELDLDALAAAWEQDYDLVILVNPNSPTGRHVERHPLERVLRMAPVSTRVWIDETYIDYTGEAQSLEGFAAQSENIVVCKSMSKAYALSGMRVAYLCAGAHQIEPLRAITPPWVVSLPAQVAAVAALKDPDYYQARYAETAHLRATLATGLRRLGWDIVDGCANFLLCHVPEDGWTAGDWVRACQNHHLFLRDASGMGTGVGPLAIRIAVKDQATHRRILRILATVRQQRESLPHRTGSDRANNRPPRDTAAIPRPGIPRGITSVVVSGGMA